MTQYKLPLKLTIAKAISNSLAHTDSMLDVGCNGSIEAPDTTKRKNPIECKTKYFNKNKNYKQIFEIKGDH